MAWQRLGKLCRQVTSRMNVEELSGARPRMEANGRAPAQQAEGDRPCAMGMKAGERKAAQPEVTGEGGDAGDGKGLRVIDGNRLSVARTRRPTVVTLRRFSLIEGGRDHASASLRAGA